MIMATMNAKTATGLSMAERIRAIIYITFPENGNVGVLPLGSPDIVIMPDIVSSVMVPSKLSVRMPNGRTSSASNAILLSVF